jgi:PAS domain S-box-containing protein
MDERESALPDRHLRILILDDVKADAELEEYELRKGGIAFTSRLAETKEDFINAIGEFCPDLILSDYKLPMFDGLSALQIARERCPDVPFILISGTVGEEIAVDALKEGATDYVLKQRLSRLVPVVKRALNEAEDRAQRKKILEQLQKSEERFRKLAEMSSMAIFMFNNKKFTFVNTFAEQLSGYTKEELLNMNFWDIVSHDFKDLIRQRGEARLRGEDAPAQYETKLLTKNGIERWVIISSGTISTEEGLSGIGTAIDITERKRTEESVKRNEQEMKAKMNELEEFYQMAVGRELRMIELKEEIEKLETELNKYRKKDQ